MCSRMGSNCPSGLILSVESRFRYWLRFSSCAFPSDGPCGFGLKTRSTLAVQCSEHSNVRGHGRRSQDARPASAMPPQTKRRCYQRRSGAPTRGTGPLRLALTGATRSGSAGVGSLARDPLPTLFRIEVESTRTTINFRPAAITHCDIARSAWLIASRLGMITLHNGFSGATRSGISGPQPTDRAAVCSAVPLRSAWKIRSWTWRRRPSIRCR
jgi:hypothetical protein